MGGDLDKMEKKRHEEAERELLLRAAKSRTKTDDPEREKLKAKAKEIRRDGLFDGSAAAASQVEDQEGPPERRDVPDGAGEKIKTLRPSLQMLLQLVKTSRDPSCLRR